MQGSEPPALADAGRPSSAPASTRRPAPLAVLRRLHPLCCAAALAARFDAPLLSIERFQGAPPTFCGGLRCVLNYENQGSAICSRWLSTVPRTCAAAPLRPSLISSASSIWKENVLPWSATAKSSREASTRQLGFRQAIASRL